MSHSPVSVTPTLNPSLSRALAEIFQLSGSRPVPGTFSRLLDISTQLQRYQPEKHGRVADGTLIWQEALDVGGTQRAARFSANLFHSNSHGTAIELGFEGWSLPANQVINKEFLGQLNQAAATNKFAVETGVNVVKFILKPGERVLASEELILSGVSITTCRLDDQNRLGPVEVEFRRAIGQTSDDVRIACEEVRREGVYRTGKTRKLLPLLPYKISGNADVLTLLPSTFSVQRCRGVLSIKNRSGFGVVAQFKL